MLKRVELPGVTLPKVYLASTKEDVMVAKKNGIPYVRWRWGMEEFLKVLMRPVLEELFPYIKWDKVLGPRRKFKTKVMVCEGGERDLPKQDPGFEMKEPEPQRPASDDDDEVREEVSVAAEEERLFSGTPAKVGYVPESIETYMGDLSSSVNIEVLQQLKLLPKFLGDITDCVRTNLFNRGYWTEGYNKKLGVPLGRFGRNGQLPNLIILDVSGSIPRGISATMISLIDTLRSEVEADLIITASRSAYVPLGCELPSPDAIRKSFGLGNESYQFFDILKSHVSGRRFGHVISFGDNDTPDYDDKEFVLAGDTCVEEVRHYHTGKYLPKNIDFKFKSSRKLARTGYAKWCHMLPNEPKEVYDLDWCDVIVQ